MAKKKTLDFLSKLLLVLFNIVMLINIFCIIKLGILPAKYFWPIIGSLAILILIVDILLSRKKKKKKGIKIFSFILIVILSFLAYYELNTLGFLSYFGKNNYKEENYEVLVLKDSKYQRINDLNNLNIGIINDGGEGQNDALKKIDDVIKINKEKYNDSESLINSLLTGKVKSILIEEGQYDLLKENIENIDSKVRVLTNYSIKIETKAILSSKDVTKETFNVYLSGIDSYGNVNKTSRSDVNLLLTINPKINKILITSIPRDYYVSLRGKNGYKDKLTHAGLYGVDTSIGTIEDLLDTKIDYYIKVNFSSVVKVVDVLGGIDVNSKYTFKSKYGYRYVKGMNHLNGEETLGFVRERKAFNGGDRVRGENQQLVLKAIIEKCIKPSILTKYSSLLKSVKDLFVTNIDDKDITKLINQQLKNNSSWDIDTYNLDGSNGYDYTYSYKSQKLYVMIPKEETVTEARNKIKLLFD